MMRDVRAFENRRLLLLVTLGAGCALACRAAGLGAAPTPTAEVLADCFWAADAFAWVDANGNGAREDDEPPLEGVEINFSPNFLGSRTTDASGMVHLSGMYPSACIPDLEISVTALALEGYAPTTPLSVAYSEDQDLYEFGFQTVP